jgi:inner membrane protein
MPATFLESFGRFTRSPGFKFFLILLLVLLLMIPLGLIWFLVSERETRANAVKLEVAELWGKDQHISGPYLIVPYSVKVVIAQGDKQVEQLQERRAVFLPDSLAVNGEAKTEIRHRAIYDTTVYGSKLTLEGRFASPDISLADADIASVRWRDAVLAVAISDVSGLTESATLSLGGNRQIPFEPSIGLPFTGTLEGIHARIAVGGAAADQAPEAFNFQFTLALNGSSSLDFAPVGRETHVTLASNWPHPSFSGAFLPETRDIRADGFTASWRVPHLARSVPQVWNLSGPNAPYALNQFGSYMFGVQFYVPIDYYDLVNRAAKYGIMFLAAAFIAVFVLELTSGKRVHPVQYVLVGLAMIIFYALLLSLAEHIGFPLAYLIASAATGGMLSLYVGYALSSAAKGLIMLCVFLILYGLLYLILRLEDYALLAGAVAGFVMLTVTMFTTLRVNWSGDEERAAPHGGRLTAE